MSNPIEKQTAPTPGGPGGPGKPGPKPLDPVKEKKKTMHAWIALFLAFVLPNFLPEIYSITRMGWQMVFTFIACMYLTISTGEVVFAALIGLIGIVSCGYMNVNEALAATLGAPSTMQVILMFMVMDLSIKSGAAENIGKFIVSRKIFHGRPALLSFAFLMMPLFISAIGGQTPVMLICLPTICFALEAAGINVNSRYSHILFMATMGISRAGSLCFDSKPFAASFLAMFQPAMAESGMAYNSLQFTGMAYVISAIAAAAVIIGMKFMGCGKDMQLLKSNNFAFDPNMQPHFTGIQIASVSIMLVYCFWNNIWTALPKSLPGYEIGTRIGPILIGAVILVILFMISIKGKRMAYPSEMASKAVVWPMVLMMCVFSVLGGSLTNEKCGISATLLTVLGLDANMSMSFPVFTAIACVFCVILTQAFGFHNGGIVLGALLAPFVPLFAGQAINFTVFLAGLSVLRGWCTLNYASCPLAFILSPRGVNPAFVISKWYCWATIAVVAVTMWLASTGLAYIL